MHIDNNKKDILVPGEDPTQGLDDTKITAEAIINLTESGKRFVLSLVIMEVTVFWKVFKKSINPKDSEIKPCPLCLGSISKDFTKS